MSAAQAEALVAHHAPRLLRDAEALVCTVTLADYPEGIAAIETADRSPGGLCIGSGHRLAEALGCRRREAAVIVGAEAVLRDALAYHGTRATDEALTAVQPGIEQLALHEAAHAVAAPPDAAIAHELLDAYRTVYRRPRPDEPAERSAATHDAPWAAVYVVLAGRAVKFRPRIGDALLDAVRADLAGYAIDYGPVAEAVAGVPADASLRELLADADFTRKIRTAIPPDAERVAVIAADLAGAGVPLWCSPEDEVTR